MGQEISISNISKISGLTAEEILDKMVEKKIGISSGGGSGVTKTDYSDIMTGTPTLGANVTIGGYEWTVCHLDYAGGIMYLIKTYIEENVAFGSNEKYKGSTIANKCATFQANLPKTVTDKLLDISVFGVTSKVFIPKASWIGPAIDFTNNFITDSTAGYFSYFNNSGARIAYGKSGTPWLYWTSSYCTSNHVWHVSITGGLGNGNFADSSTDMYNGFRPCIALAL